MQNSESDTSSIKRMGFNNSKWIHRQSSTISTFCYVYCVSVYHKIEIMSIIYHRSYIEISLSPPITSGQVFAQFKSHATKHLPKQFQLLDWIQLDLPLHGSNGLTMFLPHPAAPSPQLTLPALVQLLLPLCNPLCLDTLFCMLIAQTTE